jgi:hypothetical protein
MNTTFNAREAVKYLLDGLYIKLVDTPQYEVLFLGTDFLVIDSINIKDWSIAEFLEKFKDTNKFKFQLADKSLVKWYVPKIVWQKHKNYNYKPYMLDQADQSLYRDKNDFVKEHEKYEIKVLEWGTKYLPETYEDCE